MTKPRSFHIYPSPITHESRIFKEVGTLKTSGLIEDVFVVGTMDEGLLEDEKVDDFLSIKRFALEVDWIPHPRISRLLGYRRWLQAVKQYLLATVNPSDVLHCHSLAVLPICVQVKQQLGCALLYDAHELESHRAGWGIVRQSYARYSEKKHIPHIDSMWVVGDEIARWYQSNMQVSAEIVYNYPQMPATVNPVSVSRQDLGLNIPEEAVVCLYQGCLAPGRGLECLFDTFEKLSSRQAHLLILGYGSLSEQVKKRAQSVENVHYLGAVSPAELRAYTDLADVGFSLIEPISLSYQYALPNKLFEYMHSGLAVIASDLPAMRRVLESSGAGILIDNSAMSDRLVELLSTLSKDSIQTYQQQALLAAKGYHWTTQSDLIVNTYKSLLKNEY